MNEAAAMKRIVSTEYLFAAVLVAMFYMNVSNAPWWLLFVAFPIFDLSMAGYLINKTVGAHIYNLGHSIIIPGLLTAWYLTTSNDALLTVILLWLFHIFVDRALGYGLKHQKGFHHTHLGTIKSHKK